MNKLTIYVSHFGWGWIKKFKNKLKNAHLCYMLMPILYILVIMIVVNTTSSQNKVYDIAYVKQMDIYSKLELTNEDKLKEILNRYNLTKKEFEVVSAITLAEAEYNSYTDAYAVINTIYNRTKNTSWVKSVNNKFGEGKGESLYYQAISPRQFTVYEHGSYKKYLGVTDLEGYQAIIDFLYTEEKMHDYLSFRSNSIKVSGSVSYTAKGNNYFNEG